MAIKFIVVLGALACACGGNTPTKQADAPKANERAVVGELTEQGDLLCDGSHEPKFVNLHYEVGWMPLAPTPKLEAKLRELDNRLVVVYGEPTQGHSRPPVKHTGDCPMMQMRSDWVLAKTGMRIRRSVSLDKTALEPTRIEPFAGLSVKLAGQELVVTLENTLGVPLEDVTLRLHYEGCYGKPGSTSKDHEAGKLAPGKRVEAKFPTIAKREGGPPGRHVHSAWSVEVLASGQGVRFDLEQRLSRLPNVKVECPQD